MKICSPVTNSSTFTSVAWFTTKKTALPINEVAWLACRLFKEDEVFVPDSAIKHIERVFRRPWYALHDLSRLPKMPEPLLITKWDTFFPPPQCRVARVGDKWYISTFLLQFLSQCPWEYGDGIEGVHSPCDTWEVELRQEEFVAGEGKRYKGTIASLNLYDGFMEKRLPEMVSLLESMAGGSCLDEPIDWILQCNKVRGEIAATVWFGNVLATRYYCFWPFRDFVVALSPIDRRETEGEDPREICYGGTLLFNRLKGRKTLLGTTQ